MLYHKKLNKSIINDIASRYFFIYILRLAMSEYLINDIASRYIDIASR